VGGVYYGEVGDVVVGRITKVMQKKWKVDINGRLDGILLLSSINLPTGELRRRSAEDELAMREILKEGDVISAEIQSVYSDGSLSLHTRSVKYGKLGPGTFMKVSSSLIKRRKNHIHNLPCGVSMILGNNGYIWISPLPNGRMPGTNLEEEDPEGKKPTLEEIRINKSDRTAVARIRNCISTISKAWLPIFDTSVMYAYEASMKYECGELLRPDVVHEIGEVVRQQMLEEGALS
jgi:exosome complex component RRP4